MARQQPDLAMLARAIGFPASSRAAAVRRHACCNSSSPSLSPSPIHTLTAARRSFANTAHRPEEQQDADTTVKVAPEDGQVPVAPRPAPYFRISPYRLKAKEAAELTDLGILRDVTSQSNWKQRDNFIHGSGVRVLRTAEDVRRWSRNHISPYPGLALVPTMGALHQGHVSLIRAAAKKHNNIIVSIYVNPAQFGISEDLDSYPKTWKQDCRVIADLHTELQREHSALGKPMAIAVFAPTNQEMYPSGFPGQEIKSPGSFVTITPIGELLEGSSRPTFFRGVATVCMKLFNIVEPTRVFFGQKDIQQTVIIKKMIKDFCMPIEVAVVPTVREGDGLALSSRNVYLGDRRRKAAPVLSKALKAAERYYLDGEVRRSEILSAAWKVLNAALENKGEPREQVKFVVDYISLADPDTMEEIDQIAPRKGAIISGAIKMLPVEIPEKGEYLGHSNGPPVRLIDNIILPPLWRQSTTVPSEDQEY